MRHNYTPSTCLKNWKSFAKAILGPSLTLMEGNKGFSFEFSGRIIRPRTHFPKEVKNQCLCHPLKIILDVSISTRLEFFQIQHLWFDFLGVASLFVRLGFFNLLLMFFCFIGFTRLLFVILTLFHSPFSLSSIEVIKLWLQFIFTSNFLICFSSQNGKKNPFQ